MLTTPVSETLRFAGEIPPAAQLPLILWAPRPKCPYRRRGRFLHWPEEKPGVRLFIEEGYSAVALGRC